MDISASICALFLVELVELMYNSFSYSIWHHIAVPELGSTNPGWIGWIGFRLFSDFKEIDIYVSMCALFLVELVEFMLNIYLLILKLYSLLRVR